MWAGGEGSLTAGLAASEGGRVGTEGRDGSPSVWSEARAKKTLQGQGWKLC